MLTIIIPEAAGEEINEESLGRPAFGIGRPAKILAGEGNTAVATLAAMPVKGSYQRLQAPRYQKIRERGGGQPISSWQQRCPGVRGPLPVFAIG